MYQNLKLSSKFIRLKLSDEFIQILFGDEISFPAFASFYDRFEKLDVVFRDIFQESLVCLDPVDSLAPPDLVDC